MVDLVKIRKKSKDSKEAASSAAPSDAERPGVQPVEPPPPAANAAPVVESSPAASEPARPKPEAAAPSADTEVEVAPEPPAAILQKPAPKKSTKTDAVKTSATRVEPQGPAPAAEPEAVEPPAAARQLPADAPEDEPDDANEDRLARFKRLAGKRRRWTATTKSDEQLALEEEAKTDLELLRFRVAGENYAVDIDKIVEIVPPRGTTRVPTADESIVGIISLRGTIVTVIDLRRKLGHPRVDLQSLKDPRMIVVERAGETAGFLVDVVSRVVKLDPSQLENHPVVSSSEQSEYVSGVFQSPDGLVILLDIERILAG